MGSSSAVLKGLRTTRPQPIPRADYLLRQGVLKLLAVKDSDIRILTLEQCRDAVDKGLHAGGAFSATIPLVALYYGGFLDLDVADPTRRGQDLFTLSKGHAVRPRPRFTRTLVTSAATYHGGGQGQGELAHQAADHAAHEHQRA